MDATRIEEPKLEFQYVNDFDGTSKEASVYEVDTRSEEEKLEELDLLSNPAAE